MNHESSQQVEQTANVNRKLEPTEFYYSHTDTEEKSKDVTELIHK